MAKKDKGGHVRNGGNVEYKYGHLVEQADDTIVERGIAEISTQVETIGQVYRQFGQQKPTKCYKAEM